LAGSSALKSTNDDGGLAIRDVTVLLRVRARYLNTLHKTSGTLPFVFFLDIFVFLHSAVCLRIFIEERNDGG
jgi:hypothetical protein